MGIYTRILRPLAFRRDSELMHNMAIRSAELASAAPLLCTVLSTHYERSYERLQCDVAGLHFRNPLGLAAGYDKNARATPLWAALGFGHIEIGSVSADPSAGNPRLRLWRIPEGRGLIVNYGLPNDGADRVAKRLARARLSVPLGVNVVNTNHGPQTPPASDDAIVEDYVRSIRLLDAHAGYLILNLSCPNTADGRAFVSGASRLRRLLEAVREAAPVKPVFLKVAPFADLRALEAFLEQVDGVPFVRGFGVNLPPGKPVPLAVSEDLLRAMPGAVSGLPCQELMDRAGAELYRRMDRKRYSIIGTGGVFDADSAYRKIRLGASLVQFLTALVYEGPGIVRRIAGGLDELLARDGFRNVAEAVGVDVE
jgi:dihydroorotate dehydrogenase (fumarate)/dihydroorotate dehydrogenase